ncbi:hypothetical protein [Carnobacterium maltaromaticum]|uniref:hypothetical protein n=1 Tax=Carnobacterium maltaromaticum TaxID=2751 RepID=UPI001072BD0B|nr:hypothetical protein [Carnobacterium maltaromaticum]MDW5524652.1 hypothetical protein [Carnobacterium maltaromaticum]TFJ71908.1 hypothetical protein CKN94_11980 [Carnobacterium maltaromaticum]TFJ76821.1 hypothetical protein CKN97_11970 [Carnobacterium maltaromaticum]
MALDELVNELIEIKVNEKFEKLKSEIDLLKPWVKMDVMVENLSKQPLWISQNLCTEEQIKKRLVKKIGREWHFRNPEIFNYLHDEWWLKK